MTYMNAAQAKVLAEFIATAVRPDWDAPGIYQALGNARAMGTAADLAIAAIVAARNPENRTPAVIAMQGPHWAHAALQRKSSANATPSPSRTCGTCYLDKDACRSRWAHDHEFQSVTDLKKAIIAKADGPPPEYLKRRVRGPSEIGGRRVVNVELPPEEER